MTKHKFPYKWSLKDGYPKNNGLKVFGTFICGGGSTMGYKLAGFEHLGGVEIDPKVAAVYQVNHKPKYLYIEDIRDFVKRNDIPKELYNLDLLDGSPPCSSFSMAGNREKDWGKKKVFREGQALQVLDDLFFDYIALAKKLQPKAVIAENVKGLIQGNAKSYVKKINAEFEGAGYKVQLFLLNAASMGVPQARERVFFIGYKKELNFPKLILEFKERAILFREIENGTVGKKLTGEMLKYWKICPPGYRLSKVHPQGNFFGSMKCSPNQVCKTILATNTSPLLHDKKQNYLSKDNLCKIGSYPMDYNFQDIDPQFLIGMSVPPVMTAQIASQIKEQWFDNKCIKTVEKQLNG